MKQFIQQLKIKYKLMMIIMSTVIFSLLLVSSVLIVSERYLAKHSMADKLMTISRIIADRSTAALRFNDEDVALELLSALDEEPSVVMACLYDAAPTVFVMHGNQQANTCPDKPEPTGYRYWNERFELYQTVIQEGEVIGTVYILASLKKLNKQSLAFILMVFIVLAVVTVIAYFIARKQQIIISKPIQELTEITQNISLNGDYTARLPKGSDDEIGALNSAFNNMLEQIDSRQTERDKAEKELSEREQDLVVTLNSIGDAVIVTNLKGEITRMNPVAETLTEWSFKEANGKLLNKVFPIMNASTQKPIESPVDEILRTGKAVYLSNNTILITKTNKKIHIADSAAPIRSKNNETIGMILVFNDVTEQYKLREAAEKSKRNLQAIMDNSPASIHVIDCEEKIIFANLQFLNIFKIKHKNIINKTMHNIFTQETADKLQRFNQEVFSSGRAIEVEEVVTLKNEGEHIYSSIKFPLYDEKNKIYATCSISTDITERRKQEEQLRRSQKMDALGKLTGGIAHDYNNLLGIIIGYSELLNEKLKDNSELFKFVNDIEHAAQRGAQLTKKLLAFTRNKNADEVSVDINHLILDEQLMLEKTLTARITLKMELEKNLWPVWIDDGDLEDAIINMSINASHAIKGNGEIIFQTSNKILNEEDASALHLKAGNYVLLSITDTGLGMDDSIREKIFDPFFSTKGEGGTGLGLSQVYGFVKRSGGGIKVYSTVGQGTQFAIYFPKSDLSILKPSPSHNIESEMLRGDETILVVDDEPSLVELATTILTTQGYSVLAVDSAEAALNVLKTKDVDLMLSDVIMSGMDGYQLAEKVRDKYPNVKIQLVSGFSGTREDNVITNKVLDNEIIHKPYIPSELLKSIRNILDENKLMANQPIEMRREKQIQIDEPEKTNNTRDNSKSGLGTVLIMDDEDDVKDLFVINLEGLGYKTLTASNSEEVIGAYKNSLEVNQKIDVMILDLNIPGSLKGGELALKIRKLNKDVKLIVCSGDTSSSEMTDYKKFGFDGVLEKTFNKKIIQQLLNKLLSK